MLCIIQVCAGESDGRGKRWWVGGDATGPERKKTAEHMADTVANDDPSRHSPATRDPFRCFSPAVRYRISFPTTASLLRSFFKTREKAIKKKGNENQAIDKISTVNVLYTNKMITMTKGSRNARTKTVNKRQSQRLNVV